MLTDTRKSPNARLQGLPFSDVEWTHGLYKERFDTCAGSTVPHLQNMFESREISHVLENFRIAAGDAEYLALLKKAVMLRDSVKEGMDDNQDRLPLKAHDKIIGHAARFITALPPMGTFSATSWCIRPMAMSISFPMSRLIMKPARPSAVFTGRGACSAWRRRRNMRMCWNVCC